ncbi:hypothetical protein [Erwinia phage FBB1]|nr:hypothetical protein [Erwinia phage FBB1]
MVFTPTKNAPLNVLDYKLGRLVNFMRWNNCTESHINSVKNEFKNIRDKMYMNFTLTSREQERLESLNNVM